MKSSTVTLRLGLPALVGAEVVAAAAFALLPPQRAGWWPASVITGVALIVLVVTVYRRNAPGWVAVWARHRRRRRRPAPVAAAVDVPHGGIVCGVRVVGHEAVTMIRVGGKPHTFTLLRGPARALTANVVPVEVLAGLLDQPGFLHLACIDIVNAGRRVRRVGGYPALYSTLLADRAAAGQRATDLIVRVDITGSTAGLSYRRSIGAAAAAATERIINALLQEGIRAAALSAAELDAALSELAADLVAAPVKPVEESDTDTGAPAQHPPTPVPVGPGTAVRRPGSAAQARWRSVHTRAGYLSSYYFSPEDITTSGLNQMWALRTDEVVQMTSISKHRNAQRNGDGAVLVSAMVRTCDPQEPPAPPTLHLNPLPGEQYAATVRTAPTARPAITLPSRRLDTVEPLEIPIGSTGILVGAAISDDPQARPPILADDLVMLSLTDPERATRISMDTSEFYIRQLLIRAAAVGERIAIYSHQPSRWNSLTQPNIEVAERRRRPGFVPTISVNDRPTSLSAAGLSATVITLGEAASDGPTPDLRFVQTSKTTVQISTPTQSMEVAIVAFRQEQAWMGLS